MRIDCCHEITARRRVHRAHQMPMVVGCSQRRPQGSCADILHAIPGRWLRETTIPSRIRVEAPNMHSCKHPWLVHRGLAVIDSYQKRLYRRRAGTNSILFDHGHSTAEIQIPESESRTIVGTDIVWQHRRPTKGPSRPLKGHTDLVSAQAGHLDNATMLVLYFSREPETQSLSIKIFHWKPKNFSLRSWLRQPREIVREVEDELELRRWRYYQNAVLQLEKRKHVLPTFSSHC